MTWSREKFWWASRAYTSRNCI